MVPTKKAPRDKGKKAQLSDAEEAIGVAKSNRKIHAGALESMDSNASKGKVFSNENDFIGGERKPDHYIAKSNYETHDYEHELNDNNANSDTERISRQHDVEKYNPDDDFEERLSSQPTQKYRGTCRVTEFKGAGIENPSKAHNKNELNDSKRKKDPEDGSCDYGIAKGNTKMNDDGKDRSDRRAKLDEKRESRAYKIARIYNDESSDDEGNCRKSVQNNYVKYDSKTKSSSRVTKHNTAKTDYIQNANIKKDLEDCDSKRYPISRSYDNNFSKSRLKAHEEDSDAGKGSKSSQNNGPKEYYRVENIQKAKNHKTEKRNNMNEIKYQYERPDPIRCLDDNYKAKDTHEINCDESEIERDCSRANKVHSKKIERAKSHHNYAEKDMYEAKSNTKTNIYNEEKRDYKPRDDNQTELKYRNVTAGSDRSLSDYSDAMEQYESDLDGDYSGATNIETLNTERTKSYSNFEAKENYEAEGHAKTVNYNVKKRDYKPKDDNKNKLKYRNVTPDPASRLSDFNETKGSHEIHIDVSKVEKEINDYNAKKDTGCRLADRREAKLSEDASEPKKCIPFQNQLAEKEYKMEMNAAADGHAKEFKQKDQKLNATQKLLCIFEERGYSDNESSAIEDIKKMKFQGPRPEKRHMIDKAMEKVKNSRSAEIEKNIMERNCNILCWCPMCKNKTENRKALNVENVPNEHGLRGDKRRAKSAEGKRELKIGEPLQCVPGPAATAVKESATETTAQRYSRRSIHMINDLRFHIGYMQQFFTVMYDALNEDLSKEEGLFIGKRILGQTLRSFLNKIRKIIDDFQKVTNKIEENVCCLLRNMVQYFRQIMKELRNIKNMMELDETVAKVCQEIDKMDLDLLREEINHTNSYDFDFKSNCFSWCKSHFQLKNHFKDNQLELPKSKIEKTSLWSPEQMQYEIIEMRKKIDYLIKSLENSPALPTVKQITEYKSSKSKNTKTKQQKIQKMTTQVTIKNFKKKYQKYRTVYSNIEFDQQKIRNAVKPDEYEFNDVCDRIVKERSCTCSCVACNRAVLQYRLEEKPKEQTKHFDTDASNGSNMSIVSNVSTCLGNKILDLVGNRAAADVAIALHAETYDLYHINIVKKTSGEKIGCMYARYYQIEGALQTADLKPFKIIQVSEQ